jgi:hypothetical protein
VKLWNGPVSGSPDRTFTGIARDGSTGVWQLVDGDFGSGQTAPLGDGTWNAQVEQGDSVGNTGQSVTRAFRVDTTPPTVSLSNPAAGSATNDVTPAIDGGAGVATGDDSTVTVEIWAGSNATGPVARTFSVTRSGAAWSVGNGDYDSGDPDKAPLTDGTWTVRAHQADSVSNLGQSNERTFKVDATAPAPAMTQPADPTNDVTTNLQGTAGTQASDGGHSADNGTVTVKLWNGPVSGSPDRTFTGIARDGSTGVWQLVDGDFGSGQTAPLTDGTWTARVSQQDAAGSTGDSTARTFLVDTAAPAITSANDGQTYTLGDSVNASYSCADPSGGSGLESCNGTVAARSPLDTGSVGSHSFTVTARDQAGNERSRTVTYTVEAPGSQPEPPDTTPPALNLAGTKGTQALTKGAIVLTFSCDEVCDLTASGTITLPNKLARVYRIKSVKVSGGRGQRVVLKLTLDRRTRTAVKKALAKRKKVVAVIKLTATDQAGNKKSATKRIKIRKAPR